MICIVRLLRLEITDVNNILQVDFYQQCAGAYVRLKG